MNAQSCSFDAVFTRTSKAAQYHCPHTEKVKTETGCMKSLLLWSGGWLGPVTEQPQPARQRPVQNGYILWVAWGCSISSPNCWYSALEKPFLGGGFSRDGAVPDPSLVVQMAHGAIWDHSQPWNRAAVIWMAASNSRVFRRSGALPPEVVHLGPL